MSIAALYQTNCDRESDIFEHLPTFVELVQTLNATTVIELGVRTGVSTTAWLHGLDATNGHLWSVDVDMPPPDIPTEHWTFVRGNDTDPLVVTQLPTSADIVFIDTSHRYEQTLQELGIYVPLVRSGGRVVLHDTEVEVPDGTNEKPFPVKRAVDLYCMANGLAWTNRTNNNGLGLIEIP